MKIVIEIRKSTGGDESTLFCNELMMMYLKYAQNNNLKIEIINEENPISLSIEGSEKELDLLHGESGVHRVQRVPKTEKNGRLQTSTATVAVLNIPKSSEIKLNESELRYDTFRASGAGGQHRNTTDSAVRIVHIPTKTVVVCANERSQHKNKAQAREVMYVRLKELYIDEHEKSINKNRKQQVGKGDRSEAIRTYNYQRKKVKNELNGQSAQLKDIINKGRLELLQ